MGVFKWLRRERTPGSSNHNSRSSSEDNSSLQTHVSNDAVRDEEYDRALAEFFARRSIDANFSITPSNDNGGRSAAMEEERNHQSLPCVEYRTELSFPGDRGPKAARRHSDIPSEHGISQHSNVDSQKDKDYEKALNEYFARRSNDNTPNNRKSQESFIDSTQIFSNSETRKSLPYIKQKTEVSFSGEWPLSEPRRERKDRKSNRKRVNRIANLPQIQFLFSNQVFMPGSGSFPPQNNVDQNVAVDFDEGEPPPEFFSLKKSSLPFVEKLSEQNVKNVELRHSYTPLLRDRLISESQQDLLSGSEATADDIDSGVSAAGGGSADRQLNEIIQEWKSLDDWADEQLRINKSSTSDASFTSAQRKFEEMCRRVNGHFRGVPIVRSSCITGQHLEDGMTDLWCPGTWNTCKVYLHRVKRTAAQADNRLSNEIDILTTLRQPNMLLLMGLCYSRDQSVTMIFEECVGSLHDIIHKQNRILSAKMSVRYIRDVTNALLFLNMHDKVHRCVSSHCIMLTPSDVAKLANFTNCSPISKTKNVESPGNAADPENLKQKGKTCEFPMEFFSLLSQSESTTSLRGDRDQKDPGEPINKENEPEDDDKSYILDREKCYRWQAPELFRAGVDICEKCDVFSVCLVLWECCKLTLPWVNLDYCKLKDLYLKYGTGINLSEDDKCPECIVKILEEGLKLNPDARINLKDLMERLQLAKDTLESEEISIYKHDTETINCDDSLVTKLDEPWHLQLDENENRTFHDDVQGLAITDRTTPETSYRNSDGDTVEEKIERLPIFLKNIERYEVTDLDDCNSDTERTYPKYSPLKNSSPVTPRSDEIPLDLEPTTPLSHLQRTDSTEYCSLLSPDLKHKPFPLTSCTRPHLDSPSPIESRVARLNQSFTPKSYTPLHIRLPSVGNLEGLKQLTGGDSVKKLEAEKKYKFEIKNSSMPDTPIARSNKLRRNAWLSGENEEVQDRFNSVAAKRRHSDIPFVLRQEESNENENQIQSSKTDSESTTGCSDLRKKLLPLRSRTLFRQFSEDHDDTEKDEDATPSENKTFAVKSLSSRNLLKSPFSLESNLDRFRSRSQSWTCRHGPGMRRRRTEDEVLSRVNVKPLVAIHERWILEARQQEGRSHSLPDTERESSNPVKPASHRLDPIWPRSLNKKQTYNARSFNRSQNEIDLADRCSELSSELKEVLSRRQEPQPKDPDFYESTLWKKEKEICTDFMPKPDIQDCSTPIRAIHKPVRKTTDLQIVDSSTNTSTFEELYERIKIEVLNALGLNVQSDLPLQADNFDALDKLKSLTVHNSTDEVVKSISSSIMLSLGDLIERKKNGDCVQNKVDNCNDVNSSCLYSAASNKNFLSKTAVAEEDTCNCTRDDDAVSLPEQFSSEQNEDFSHKTLKRCQAFTALQEARSTEDLYIDDELVHPDNMETLGDNMKLIPLHGSLHEALCDKYEECCLIKIQEETDCSHMYIVCDKTSNDQDVKEGGYLEDGFRTNRTFPAIVEEQDEELYDDKCQSPVATDNATNLTVVLQSSSEKCLPVIEEECELPSEQIKENTDCTCEDKDTSFDDNTEPILPLGNFNLKEMLESVQNKLVENRTNKIEDNINMLSDFVNSFACPDIVEHGTSDGKELQSLLIVEDFEELLNGSSRNEGYAELCPADEIETQKLIDLDLTGSSNGNNNTVSFCND